MAQKRHPNPATRPNPSIDERARRDEEEQSSAEEPRTKPESEMSRGKDYPWELPENRQEFDPATTPTPQEGQGQGA